VEKILLSSGRHTLIDSEDFSRVCKHKWRDAKGSVITTIKENNKYKTVSLHRFILNYNGKKFIDHINNNPLDNRKENLRIATISENGGNSLPNYNKTYKGISYRKEHKHRLKPYYCRITCRGKVYELGYYKTEIEAIKAYNKKAKELFGEFAKINKLEEAGL